MMRKIALAVVIIGAAGYFALWLDERRYEQRPGNVPPTATWVDGGKGWRYWIDCKAIDNQPNKCKFYAPRTGELISDESYVVRGSNRGASKDELKVIKYDEEIVLADGTRLVVKRD